MMRMGERSYVYAKACGVIGKSFVGKRIAPLGALSRLAELDRLVFPLGGRDLPERELLLDLENRIVQRGTKQILTIISSFSKPPALLLALLRSCEYEDLKSALSALAESRSAAPPFTALGPYGRVKFNAYPNLKAMVGGTDFAFLLSGIGDNLKAADDIAIQAKLDRHYYTGLWEALHSHPRRDREGIGKILTDELSLRNAVWMLRLRIYYGMSAEEAREQLVVPETGGKRNSVEALLADALFALKPPLDNRAAWEHWKWAGMLNPAESGGLWRADPRHFQNSAAAYLYRLARTSFRRRPFSLDTAACFIKLKQFEEDLLTSVAEGLGLGLPGAEIFNLLGRVELKS